RLAALESDGCRVRGCVQGLRRCLRRTQSPLGARHAPRVQSLLRVLPRLRKILPRPRRRQVAQPSPRERRRGSMTSTRSLCWVVMALASPAHAKYTCNPPAGVYPEVCDIGSSMPVYDQTHPAFATVNVPNDIYCSELKPAAGVAGQLCIDGSLA